MLNFGGSLSSLAAMHPGLLMDEDNPPALRSSDAANQSIVEPLPMPPLEVLALSQLIFDCSTSTWVEIDSRVSTPIPGLEKQVFLLMNMR